MEVQKGNFETKADGSVEFVPSETGRFKVCTPDHLLKGQAYVSYISGIDPYDKDKSSLSLAAVIQGGNIISTYEGRPESEEKFREEIEKMKLHYNALEFHELQGKR